jgi:hypothetical protein
MKTSKLYNWVDIQKDYDSGLSQRDIIKKYGMSSRIIFIAVQNGDFKSKSRSAAAKLDAIKNPKTHSEEFKIKQRNRIIARYEAGWSPKAGRCRKYKHVSPIAGEVSLDGTWELAVAVWLDSKRYRWRRNTKRFQYINLKGTISHYTPDFWVAELNGYLEVKGYETELDRCKWAQFTEPLTVWKKKELTEMKLI